MVSHANLTCVSSLMIFTFDKNKFNIKNTAQEHCVLRNIGHLDMNRAGMDSYWEPVILVLRRILVVGMLYSINLNIV